MSHWNPILVTKLKASHLQNASEAKIRTVLSRFWSEKCIVGPNGSKTLPYTCKPHFIITNDVSRVSRTGGLAGFFLADFEGSCADSVHPGKSLWVFYLSR